jgi:chromosome segregation ATPase
VIDGEEIEVCGSSGTTIKYKGDVYWTKNYIDKKFRNKDKTIQNLTNRLEDCHYDLDKSKMTLENYKETWREMQKENKQLKYKLDKGEMYSKKDLMEKLDGKDLEIKRLEKEIAKQDGREELAEVQYENTRLGGILMDKSKKIEELDEELNNAYEELEEVKATLQQYKDHGF